MTHTLRREPMMSRQTPWQMGWRKVYKLIEDGLLSHF